ncbi:MAG: glycosyltransferase family 4 protein [Pseudomonadota bacterium]
MLSPSPSKTVGQPLAGLRLALVLKGYPRLSETFIAQEIEGLEARGAAITLISLRHPTDKMRHPVHERIQAPVIYLPEYLYQEPWRVLRACFNLPKGGRRRVLAQWWRDFRRDPTANRVRRLGQAIVLAAALRHGPDTPDLIYGHFIHTPSSVARYASGLLGLPYAISAHAKDIYTSPDWELREKLDGADWAVTCTAGNLAYLQERTSTPDHVHLVYHGLADIAADQQMAKDDSVLRLVTIGRAVPKKGLDTILQALAQLPSELAWHWHHVGAGDLLDGLKNQAQDLGLGDRITWHGAQPQAVVREQLAAADLFLLASRVMGDGDRDGLPNVLMEAAVYSVPTVATTTGAIPEFVENGVSGVLVAPDDPTGMAQAIQALAQDRVRLTAYGEAAQERLQKAFTFDQCLTPLVELLTDYRSEDAPDGVSSDLSPM